MYLLNHINRHKRQFYIIYRWFFSVDWSYTKWIFHIQTIFSQTRIFITSIQQCWSIFWCVSGVISELKQNWILNEWVLLWASSACLALLSRLLSTNSCTAHKILSFVIHWPEATFFSLVVVAQGHVHVCILRVNNIRSSTGFWSAEKEQCWMQIIKRN